MKYQSLIIISSFESDYIIRSTSTFENLRYIKLQERVKDMLMGFSAYTVNEFMEYCAPL